MKLISIMILIVLCFSILSPVTIVCPYKETERSSIIMLDVCHSSGTGVLISLDIPFIYECLCKPIPLRFAGFYEFLNSVSNPFLIVLQKEHPPRV